MDRHGCLRWSVGAPAACDAIGVSHEPGCCPMRGSDDFGLLRHSEGIMLPGAGENRPVLRNPHDAFPDDPSALGTRTRAGLPHRITAGPRRCSRSGTARPAGTPA
ncbi:amidohydrolase (plasmid) [Paracoccus yeei]|uniref:Amidohydrolase n=1 Tax=Paracoccus yeei TaxID=147645 RepID=A0A386UUB0_9RHOB|nr:amidohydrolase [Paracoccus yeei]